MVYFSEIKEKTIFDANNKDIGTLKDLVFVDGEKYAEITHLIYLDEKKYKKKIPWDVVKELKSEANGISTRIGIILNIPAEKITALDTTGAGDGFCAGFIAGYISGETIEQAITLGTELGAHICKGFGARFNTEEFKANSSFNNK